MPRGRTLHKSTRPLSKWLQGLGAVCVGTMSRWVHATVVFSSNTRTNPRADALKRSNRNHACVRANTHAARMHTQLRRATDGPYQMHRTSALQSAIGSAMQSSAMPSAVQSSAIGSAMQLAQRSAGSCRLDSLARQSELHNHRQCPTAGESAHIRLKVPLTDSGERSVQGCARTGAKHKCSHKDRARSFAYIRD